MAKDYCYMQANIFFGALFVFFLFNSVNCCAHDYLLYPTTLYAGQFSYSRNSDIEATNDKGRILLASPTGSFFLSMTNCRLVIAHNDTGIVHTVVWHVTFPSCAMESQIKLSFLSNGNLVVMLTQNVFSITNSTFHEERQDVWSTNTSGKGVQKMELNDNGNLILYDGKGVAIWQSFYHPSSVLLSNQVLEQGMSLNIVQNFLNFSLVIEMNRVALYVIDYDNQDSKPYWELLPNSPSNASIAYAALDEEGNFQLYDSTSNPLVRYLSDEKNTNWNVVGSGFTRFNMGDDNVVEPLKTTPTPSKIRDMNKHQNKLWRMEITTGGIATITNESTMTGKYNGGGNLEIYEWMGSRWELKAKAINNRCGFPSSCPRYSTCDPIKEECMCIEPMFVNNDDKQSCTISPNLRDMRLVENQCNRNNSKVEDGTVDFMEIQGASYFTMVLGGGNVGYNASLLECRSYCVQNCSCAAFVYEPDLVPYSCYLIHVFPLQPHDPSTLNFLIPIDHRSSSVYVKTLHLTAKSSSTSNLQLSYFQIGLDAIFVLMVITFKVTPINLP